MSLLVPLAFLVGNALAAPAGARGPGGNASQAEARTACDGLGFVERLACVERTYPKVHATVEGLCTNLEPAERRACRAREYEARGIAWSKSDEEGSARGRGGEAPSGSRSRTSSGSDAGGGRGGSVPSGGSPSTSGGSASGSGSTSASTSGLGGTGSSGGRGGSAGGSVGSSGSTSAGSSSGTGGSRGGTSSSGGSSGSSSAAGGSRGGAGDVKLDASAASIAAMSLTLAGTAMQQVPSLCSKNPKCGLSSKEQTAVAAFGGVIATQASTIPGILASGSSDAAKATQIATVLAAIAAKAPTGLGSEAQGYVNTAAAAIGAISGAIGR